jgi:hypothetical protein
VHEEVTAAAAMGTLAVDAHDLRAEVAAGLRRAIAVLRGEVAWRIPAAEAEAAAARAERDAARADAAASAATAAAAVGARDAAFRERDEASAVAATRAAERDQARRELATRTAERDEARTALAALQQIVSDLRRDLAADAAEREELRRRAEVADVADAIARKVATPLTTSAASAYLRASGFPAGSQPAGITWGIDTVPAGRLTASSVHDNMYAVHPGCRLKYPDGAIAGRNIFATGGGDVPGIWLCVNLGGERSVVGALVQSWESTEASTEGGNCWHRHKFQWSADGATWTDVDGGRVWSRDGLARKDVSACVFGAPVRCRYLRIVAVSRSGALRWEVVVLP